MRQLTIEPEFRDKIPPLSAEEFSRLEENILADGEVLEPLVVWHNTVVDGHHRWAIIQKHPEIPYKVKQVEFPDKWAAIAWMCRNQLGRRNLTDEQKSYLRGRQYEAEKMSQGGTGANQYANTQTGQNVQSAPQTRREQQDGTSGRIGKENGVDGRTIRRDADFANGLDAAEVASPGIREAILSGEVKAPKSVIAMIRNIPDEQKKEAANAVKAGDVPTAKEIVRQFEKKEPTPPAEEEPHEEFNSEDLRDLLDEAMETLDFTLRQHLVLIHSDILATQAGNDVARAALKKGHSILENYQKHVRGVIVRVK